MSFVGKTTIKTWQAPPTTALNRCCPDYGTGGTRRNPNVSWYSPTPWQVELLPTMGSSTPWFYGFSVTFAESTKTFCVSSRCFVLTGQGDRFSSPSVQNWWCIPNCSWKSEYWCHFNESHISNNSVLYIMWQVSVVFPTFSSISANFLQNRLLRRQLRSGCHIAPRPRHLVSTTNLGLYWPFFWGPGVVVNAIFVEVVVVSRCPIPRSFFARETALSNRPLKNQLIYPVSCFPSLSGNVVHVRTHLQRPPQPTIFQRHHL